MMLLYTPTTSNDDEISDDSARLAVWIVLFLIFIVSAWFSWREVKYAVWGRTAQAEVFRIRKYQDNRDRHPRDTPIADVRYRWTDRNDGDRNDAMLVPLDSAPIVGEMIAIDYLPGEKTSRLTGDRNLWAIGFVLLTSAALSVWFVKTWRDGTRRSKPARPHVEQPERDDGFAYERYSDQDNAW